MGINDKKGAPVLIGMALTDLDNTTPYFSIVRNAETKPRGEV